MNETMMIMMIMNETMMIMMMKNQIMMRMKMINETNLIMFRLAIGLMMAFLVVALFSGSN